MPFSKEEIRDVHATCRDNDTGLYPLEVMWETKGTAMMCKARVTLMKCIGYFSAYVTHTVRRYSVHIDLQGLALLIT